MTDNPPTGAWNRWDASFYDDDAELTGYLLHNYSRLLTKIEWKVWISYRIEWQNERAAADDPSLAASCEGRQAKTRSDPQVAEALSRVEAFAREARERILSEHAGKLIINRCARCQRVVATPKARQCLWCGYDWQKQP
jgi:hypothetical protein